MIIIELGGDLMKILFQRKGSKVDFVDLTRRIISIDGKFVNELGEEIQVEEKLYKRESLDDYEEEELFTLEYVTPEHAISVNENADHGEKADSQTFEGMILRENKVLEIIQKEVLES